MFSIFLLSLQLVEPVNKTKRNFKTAKRCKLLIEWWWQLNIVIKILVFFFFSYFMSTINYFHYFHTTGVFVFVFKWIFIFYDHAVITRFLLLLDKNNILHEIWLEFEKFLFAVSMKKVNSLQKNVWPVNNGIRNTCVKRQGISNVIYENCTLKIKN